MVRSLLRKISTRPAIKSHQRKLKIIWRTYPLSLKSWGDESVIFNKSSGSTHLVKPIAAKVLAFLQSQPSSAAEIAERVAAEIELDPDEEILHRVQVVLKTLDDLGLIESVPQ
jgi:PqqD family protein of HPr-rel-A system